jgi:hypothetical protein
MAPLILRESAAMPAMPSPGSRSWRNEALGIGWWQWMHEDSGCELWRMMRELHEDADTTCWSRGVSTTGSVMSLVMIVGAFCTQQRENEHKR